MSAPALTPAVYSALMVAFRGGATVRAAAAAAQCSRDMATAALTGGYAKRFEWAPAIRDVISGAVPVPVMPTIWPPPAPVKPSAHRPDAPPPTLAIVRPLRPAKELADRPRPGLAAPPERTEEPQALDASADPTTAGNAALAMHRGSLTAQARAIARSGPDFAVYHEWLVRGMVTYAKSMSGPDVVVSLADLLYAAQIGGIVASTMDKIGAALERVIAAERKLNPPPKDKPPEDNDGWSEVMGKRRGTG